MPARIVMAHDDEAFVIAATVALRNAGYSIVAFTDSMAALEALSGRPFGRASDHTYLV